MTKLSLLFAFVAAVGWHTAAADEEVELLLQTTESWDGNTLISYGKGAPEITILRVVIPSGYQVKTHRHPTINAAVVISGELTLQAEDGQERIVGPGDAVVEVIEKWHTGKTTSEEPAVLIVFYAGVEGQPLTVWQE